MSKYDDPGWNEESEHNATHPSSRKQSSPESFNPLSPLAQTDNNPFMLRNARAHQPHPASNNPFRKKFGQVMLKITLLVIAFLSGWFGQLTFANSFDASNQSQFYAHLTQQAWTDIDQNYVSTKPGKLKPTLSLRKLTYKDDESETNILEVFGLLAGAKRLCL